MESPVYCEKIWDHAPHNAFTDLCRFGDRWFCAFREGSDHVSRDGALRIISSIDGEKWESSALIESEGADLRDPKLVVTPDGRLMLCAAEARNGKPYQSLVWFSGDGSHWGESIGIGEPDFWIWRITWHEGIAYGVGYGCAEDQSVRLYSSRDGKTFERLVERFFEEGFPNESSIVFAEDRAWCLLRRDSGTGLLGTAWPPYKDWEWKDLGERIGGPHMLILPDGRLVAAVRLHEGGIRTSLCLICPEEGTLSEFLKLPSGGDTSYPGIVLHDGLLWVSYYSSHEGKTAIYLARAEIPG